MIQCADCKDKDICYSLVREFYSMLKDKCCDNGQIVVECSYLQKELIGSDKM